MPDLIHFLGVPVSPSTFDDVVSRLPTLLGSANLFVWLFVIIVLRYDVPAFIVWIINMFNPRAFRPPWNGEPYQPSVSVIIAGRNPGAGIRQTISTVLESGYPRVEVLYADDFSTDDSVSQARAFERTGLVRVFASQQHTGKPSNLNIAIFMARGELAFVLDSDTEIEPGTIERMVAYFRDPRVGAVTANIFVRNAKQNLLTRLQEVEYALNGSVVRLWRSQVGLLPILPGAASMFRTSALRQLGGYDTGLGDDTDMTLRMRKVGWKLVFVLDARVWTDQPHTWPQLFRQRIRWERNMVKIRLRKHADLINPRYGWDNTIIALDNWIFRVILPVYAVFAIIHGLFLFGTERAVIFTSLYAILVFLVACRVLIASDLARTPPLYDLILTPLYPIYRFILRAVDVYAIVREALRIGLYHPYVPRRIWKEIPHW